MTFGSTFGRVFSPTFQAKSQEVAGDWWLSGGINPANCVAAYQPKGAVSLAASYINLVNSETHTIIVGSAPTWDYTNGWKFTNTQYLITDIECATDQSWSMIVAFNNYYGLNCFISGSNNGNLQNGKFYVGANWTSKRIYGNGGYLDADNAITSGILCVAGNKGYYNGALDVTSIDTWTNGGISYPIFINGINQTGSSLYRPANYIQALAIYSIVLNSGQVSALTTAMAAL